MANCSLKYPLNLLRVFAFYSVQVCVYNIFPIGNIETPGCQAVRFDGTGVRKKIRNINKCV